MPAGGHRAARPGPFTAAFTGAESRRGFWPAAVAVASVGVGKLVLEVVQLGPVAGHMGAHILLMNAVTPFLAIAALGRFPALAPRFSSGRVLLAASVVQVAVLWAWHAPAALAFSLGTPGMHALTQASLLAAAGWFWLAVLADRSAARWRALFALLLTGKLFCLLGVLLVFAPRLIYPGLAASHGHGAVSTMSALSDQQLAGLLMLVACPLSYLVAGVTIAARWLGALAESERTERSFTGSA